MMTQGKQQLNHRHFEVKQILSFEEAQQIIMKNDELLSSGVRDALLFKVFPFGETVYQVWNKEYIKQLADAIKKLKITSTVLEVCAGDGKLSQYLSQQDINITTTDDYSWTCIKKNKAVQRFDAIEAIKKFKPELVIASWIPNNNCIDYSILLTKVKYFIMIGEAKHGCCGSDYIWDNYENLNYSKTLLHDVDKYNICRTDHIRQWNHSQTVLFTHLCS